MTHPTPESRRVDTARQLLTLTELIDVEYLEVSARKRDGSDNTPELIDEVDVSVQVSLGAQLIEVRCLAQAESTVATFCVDVVGKFATYEPVEIADDALSSFIGSIALPSIYPFLRESIFQAAAKLRVDPPLLSLLRTADVKVNVPISGNSADMGRGHRGSPR